MKVFIALCLLTVTMAMPKVAFPNADLIRNNILGIQHPSQKLIEEARTGESRIVGGSNVDISDHPWQASLQYNGRHICGASLISSTWLITAAHCVDFDSASKFSVVLGVTKQSDFAESYQVRRKIEHEDYLQGYGTYPNDIALLELSKPVDLSGNSISKIDMLEENGNFNWQNCKITGWGLTSGGGPSPNNLQEVKIDVISNSECRNRWGSTPVLNSHVCVYTRRGISACNGDSGGPLVCDNKLVGATSWGHTSCDGQYPSVYTRISSFRTWIRNNSGV